jgi:hypothetical protein
MNRRVLVLTLIILGMALVGCAGRAERAPIQESAVAYPVPVMEEPPADSGYYVEAEEAAVYEQPAEYGGGPDSALPGQPTTGGSLEQAVQRLIIRTGNISMTAEDTRATQEAIEDMVAGWESEGAFVVSSNEYGGEVDGSPYISMQIRVPSARFDAAMDNLADMAVDVLSRSESGQDVTEEYVDLQARLESLETARQRLLEIMQDAQSTEDLLMAEQQLTYREQEIESITGRIQFLEQSAALSSISIDLQPYILAQPVDTSWRPAETVRRAFDSLLSGLRWLADTLILFGIGVLPVLAIIGLIIYLIVRVIIWLVRLGSRRRAARSGEE